MPTRVDQDGRPWYKQPVSGLSFYRRLLRVFLCYKNKKTVLPYGPLRLWVEPTSFCTLQCVMCPNKDLTTEERGFMELDLFRKIIDEASAFVFDVHLHHRGETLLHPRFFEMAQYAAAAGVKTKLHTNATVLDEEKSRRLIESGLDRLSFSFDGYDKDSYEKIRVGGEFEKTVGNIIRFLETKKALRFKKPETVLEIIDFPEIYRGIAKSRKKAFLDGFRGLSLDKVIIKEMHNWAGETGPSQTQARFSPCTFLWQALVVLWDGAVLPCTQDFHGYYILGNVKDSSLAQIWNNEKTVSLREKMVRGDIVGLETCSRCDRVRRKQFLGIPREYLWKFLLNRMT